MSASEARSFRNTYVGVETKQKEQTQHRVKVTKKAWVTKGEKIIYVFVSVCLLAAVFLMLQFSKTTDSVNRDIQELKWQIETQKVENASLKFEKEKLNNPDRIIEIAGEHGLNIQNAKVRQAVTFNK